MVPLLAPFPCGGCREDPRPDAPGVRASFFGKPRHSGSSHLIFKTPWPGDPRVNIQDAKGKVKPYQVRQVLLAIDRLERQQ